MTVAKDGTKRRAKTGTKGSAKNIPRGKSPGSIAIIILAVAVVGIVAWSWLT